MTLVDRTQTPPTEGPPPRGSHHWSGFVAAVIALALIGLAALGLGHFGSKAVYILVGVSAVVLVIWSIRDLLGPAIGDAARRTRPKPIDAPPIGPVRTFVGAVVATLAAGTLAFAVASASNKLLYGVIALVVLTIGLWLLWPVVLLLFNTPPERYRPAADHHRPGSRSVRGEPHRSDSENDHESDGLADTRAAVPTKEQEWEAIGLGRETSPRPGMGRLSRAVGMVLAVMAAGMVAFLAATAGSKALLVIIGAVVVVGCLVRARDKSLFTVFGTVCALAFLVHKSFGGIDLTDAGGAPSIYITSFDAMILLLYALWVSEGTFVADVRGAVHRRILWIPLIGAVLMLPSLLAGDASTMHGLAELARMGWMYLIFFYVAVRVRSRAMVWAILAGFAAFAVVEFIVVILQWKTGGVLGLSFLGVPTQLNHRITDTAQLGRPFGTIIHPDFMGAAMGSIGLLAFAFGLTLRRSLTKVAALGLFAACALCLYLAHTRSALVGLVAALLGMVVVAIIHRQLQWRMVGRVLLVLLIATTVFFPQLQARFSENFGTGHFGEEVTSRLQLNDVADQMFADHPILGVGLNSSQLAMGPYETHGVIFINNPVQNLYLLYLSETGIIGMAGFLLVGIAMYNVALRLARSRDRLFGGVGLGVSAAMAFLMIEELLTFSLRQDVPLAVYWIFAGLAVACYRMAGLEGTRRPPRPNPYAPGNRPLPKGERRPREIASRPAHAAGSPRAVTKGGRGTVNSNPIATWVEILRTARWPRRGARRPAHLATSRVDPASPRGAGGISRGPRTNRHGHRSPALRARRVPLLPAGTVPALPAGASGQAVAVRRGASRRLRASHLRLGVAILVLGALLAAGIQGLAGADPSTSVPSLPTSTASSTSVPAGTGTSTSVLVVPVGTGTSTSVPNPPAGPSADAGVSAPTSVSKLRVVFSARADTAPGAASTNGIFVGNADGTDLKPLIVSNTNTLYNWPQWALGGTKIIFTVRNGPRVSSTDRFPRYENIWEMNPDGSDKRALTDYKFRAVQPKVSPDGRSVIFTAQNPLFPLDAVYKLNLLTLQATNLSQVTQPDGAVDADAKWTPDGRIVMTATQSTSPGTAIDEMNADGTDRQVLLSDGNFNTDPEVSPDGSAVSFSAFDGPDPVLPGATLDPTDPDDVPLNPQGWFIKVRNQATGATSTLTEGNACDSPKITCQAGQSSGWKPVWSPDGTTIAWAGRLNSTTTCICAANADGSDPRVLIKSNNLVIKWFDWTAPGGQAPSTAVPDSQIGSQQVSSRLLISGEDLKGHTTEILNTPVDMMGDVQAGTGTTSDPSSGSWSQNRSEFAFVANANYDANNPQYGPPPPPGQHVHEHFTLQQLQPALGPLFPPNDLSPQEQIFLHRSDGTIVQLTTPWTEDWQDALDVGDARANTDPVISPNGQYVVFTNHSSLTGESFLLRMDLQTGAVLNLTNGTAGAMQVDDALPRWSPDSSKIAFTTADGAATDVYVMNASDGTTVTAKTDDQAYDMDPTWSPDGKSIVYSSHNGTLDPSAAQVESLTGLPRAGWSLVKVDVATGQETVLTTPNDSPTWRPVYSPDGSQIDFIGWKYRTLDIFQTTPSGGPVQPLLITPLLNETSVDWK
jgi:Tol biopolymer transport system component/O-antigen ligase